MFECSSIVQSDLFASIAIANNEQVRKENHLFRHSTGNTGAIERGDFYAFFCLHFFRRCDAEDVEAVFDDDAHGVGKL